MAAEQPPLAAETLAGLLQETLGRNEIQAAHISGYSRFTRDLIDRLDGWVHDLAAPAMPPRLVRVANGTARLEFRQHVPQTVMIGKLVRAVSGIRGALVLADLGYVVECAALLRMVSDICIEVTAVGQVLHRGSEPPAP
jgi:hypothetical protein